MKPCTLIATTWSYDLGHRAIYGQELGSLKDWPLSTITESTSFRISALTDAAVVDATIYRRAAW